MIYTLLGSPCRAGTSHETAHLVLRFHHKGSACTRVQAACGCVHSAALSAGAEETNVIYQASSRRHRGC